MARRAATSDEPPPARYVVGFDLGTTNSAVSYVDTEKRPWRVRTFRVRVSPRDKPGSRVITVRSESLHGARARALARAGRGWKIADIQEI